MTPFNDDFHKSNQSFWTLAKAFVAGWVVWGLISLGLTIAIIVVAVHFIAKFW